MTRKAKIDTIVIDGAVLDVRGASQFMNQTERATRGQIARGLLPHRRLGGKIVFIRSELQEFVMNLPGTSLAEARENLRLRSGEQVQR